MSSKSARRRRRVRQRLRELDVVAPDDEPCRLFRLRAERRSGSRNVSESH